MLPADRKVHPIGGPKSPHYTLNVRLAGEARPDSELFLPPTFISPGQRKLLWSTVGLAVCFVLCTGFLAGIGFLLVAQYLSGVDASGSSEYASGSSEYSLAEEEAASLPSNVSDNCTLTYDPEVVSELMREAYVSTFFNVTCLASNGTGDPCDLHVAEEYTYRMVSALRFDRLVMELFAFVVIFSFAQIGGIPRPTDRKGLFFWLAWMVTQLAQYVVILCALLMQVCSFLGVRARLSPCLVQVDGTALLDFYAMCTFAVQPELVIKATMLFVYAFLLSLGMLVFDGSREWPWLTKLEVTAEEILVTLTLTPNPSYGYSEDPNLVSLTLTAAEPNTASAAEPGGDKAPSVCATTVQSLGDKLTARFPRAARFIQSSPIPRVKFVENATGPIMPKDKRFKARLSLALCHYHVARTIVLGTCFSMWAAALGSLTAAPGVTSAWVLALLVAVLTAMVPWAAMVTWARMEQMISTSFTLKPIVPWLPYIMSLLIFCPLLSASAILPLSALFLLVVQLAYFLGRRVLAHIGPSADGNEQVWVGLPEGLTNRCCCKWTDALAGPTRTCLSWIQSTSIFSYADGVLGRSQGKALAFTGTSYATLAGGLSCFWVLLAFAPVASHTAWARARSLISFEGVADFANDTTSAVGDVDGLTGEWIWVWSSLMLWLWLGAAIVLCCCSAGNVLAGRCVYEMGKAISQGKFVRCRSGTIIAMIGYFPTCWVKLFAQGHLNEMPLRARWLLKTAGACSLFAFIIFIFTATQTAGAKELIATTYSSSSVALSGLQLDWNGALPSFDELVEVLNDPAAALSSAVQRMVDLSSYAKFDPAYFSEGVQALTAINLVLSFVKLLATYGRKLFALMDAAKSILKTYTGHEAASEGDDGTVQVCETMTDLAAIAILGLLNTQEVKDSYKWKHGEEVSFAKLMLQEELIFDFCCELDDGKMAGGVALVTHSKRVVQLRSLSLEGSKLVTAEAWEKALTDMLTKGSLTILSDLNLGGCGIGIKGGAVIAEALRVSSSLTSLDVSHTRIGKKVALELVSIFKEKQMTSVGLGGCDLGPDGGKVVAEYVSVSSSLTYLDVCESSITDDGAQQLAAAVLGNQTVEIFCYIPLKELRADQLTTLDLGHGSNIEVPGALLLAELLRTVSGSLTSLDLSYDNFGPEGGKAVAEALRVNSSLTSLDMERNYIGPEGGKAIGEALCVNGSLTSINLSHCGIGPEGGVAIAEALKVNCSLTTLYLNDNQIGDEGPKAIGAALAVNGSLTEVE